MNINKNRVGVCPVSYEGCEIVDPYYIDAFKNRFEESPSFEYAVKIDGKSLGDIESMVGNNSFNLQDPEHRNKDEQVEQQIAGKLGEVAFQYIADEVGLDVEWLDDKNGYAFDNLLIGDGDEFGVEVKVAQMSSKGHNVPIRGGKFDSRPKHAFRQDGLMTDVLVFAYLSYDGGAYYVGFEGCEPVAEESNGLLSREHKTLYNGDLFLYESRYIRHRITDIDKDILLDKL